MSRFLRYKLDHLLFWVLTIFFHGYTRLSLIELAGVGQFVLEIFIRNGLLACAIYFTILFSIPRLTNGKNALIGIAGLLAAFIIYVAGKNVHDAYLYGYFLGDAARQGLFHNTFYNSSIVLFYLAFASTLHLSKQWFLQREQIRAIELEKLNTELEYLRAQINPHFLFNSINTIYFQIDKQNHSARETLGKFSDMLRYQLYECTGREIVIEKEIAYLQNYLELQKLRVSENYVVQFSASPDLNNFNIPPLLLIPFIENAFKHVSHFTDRKNEIQIRISRSNSHLQLQVDNTKESNAPKQETGGIGLKNVKRRLDLIFAGRAQLRIEEKPEHYSVTLQLPIE